MEEGSLGRNGNRDWKGLEAGQRGGKSVFSSMGQVHRKPLLNEPMNTLTDTVMCYPNHSLPSDPQDCQLWDVRVI